MAKKGIGGKEFNKAVKNGVNQIGAAFSKLFNKKLSIKKISTSVFASGDISKNIGGPSEKLVVVSFGLEKKKGKLGNMLMIYPQETGFLYSELLNQKKLGKTKTLSEEDQSAIKEASNIAAGHYLTAIAASKGAQSIQGVPRLFSTEGESVTNFLFLGSKKKDGLALSVEVQYSIPSLKKSGKFFFLIDLDALGALIEEKEKKVLAKTKIKKISLNVPTGLSRKIGKGKVIVLTIPEKKFRLGTLGVASLFAKNYKATCFVTLNNPHNALVSLFKRSGISEKNFLFIDGVTKSIDPNAPEADNCLYTTSTSAMLELGIIIEKVLKTKKFEALLFNGITTLPTYNDLKVVREFIHQFVTKVRATGITVVFIISEADRKSVLLKEMSMFVDEVIGY